MGQLRTANKRHKRAIALTAKTIADQPAPTPTPAETAKTAS